MAPLPEHLQPMPVGRHPLSREVMAAHQRGRVLDAATEVFAKRGYQGTTVDHIVAAAQIGVGSFYALFEGKEDCFLQAYDRIVAEARERIAAAIPPEAPWPEQLCAALRTLLEAIAAEPLRARVALVEIQTAGPSGLARYEATLDGVAAQLRRGRAFSSAPDALPGTLETATIGGLTWLLQQRAAKGEAGAVQVLLSELLTIALEPYLGEDETARVVAAQQGAEPGAPAATT